MEISAIHSSNYANAISDYKYVRNKIVPKNSSVNFRNSNFEIKTQRTTKDISLFVINSKLNDTKKIDAKERKHEELIEKYDKNFALLRNAPILDRFDYVISKLKQGEYVSASTMGILSILYGPEDLREVGSAYKQIKSLFQGKEFINEYNYKVAQHPFSFFRGSILHKALNPFASNNIDIENYSPIARWWSRNVTRIKIWLIEKDKALVDTRFWEKVLNFFNIKIMKVKTPIEEIVQKNNRKNLVEAYKYISDSKLGKLTARAMTTVPVLGTVADATIEALEVRNDIKDGENFFESAGNAVARYATSTITTAYLGAVCSKFGPIGSLGSIVLANYICDKFEKAID